MKILLSGFEPFGNITKNPSFECIKRVQQQKEVEIICLPVVYQKASDILQQKIKIYKPDLVLSVGVSGMRNKITPELLAVNFKYANTKDNEGNLYLGEKICKTAQEAYMTSFDLPLILQALESAHIPSALSLSAGAYVCNDVYYGLLKNQKVGHYKGLFVHVPSENEMEIDQMAQGILKILEEMEHQAPSIL